MRSNIKDTIFYRFLSENLQKGGFTNDDAVSVTLPMLKIVAGIHDEGKVADLRDIANVLVDDDKLNISRIGRHPSNNSYKFLHFFNSKSKAFDISEVYTKKVEIGGDTNDEISDESVILGLVEKVSKPAYLLNFHCFEFDFEHHDALSDIYVLGMILASVSLNFDFSKDDDLQQFVANRKSLVFLNPKIHPAIANIILGMTELNRHKRWKDLNEIIEKLKNYREYNPENEYDLSQILKSKKQTSRSRFIHEKLRNRLFDTSRRNRMLYYQPNLKFLNLTVSSVPQLLNYKNIDPNSIFYWNQDISKKITNNSSISLNKYLRFEDNPYITPTLDKIRLESNKDINEYGFSQLKLVLCFLNWYNTKENGFEKIHSPLLLVSANLVKKKGIKEQFTLEFSEPEVEINPILANTLRELYDIRLPETIQLSETNILGIYELLKLQIEKNNSGIVLENIDKPRIKLIYTQAKKTLTQYLKKTNKRQATSDIKNVQYSYDLENFQPYGLELFKQYVLSEVSDLQFLIDSDIKLSQGSFNENTTIDREFYTLDEGAVNPFVWEFDSCNMVLGNFNYKKMSLVRDYNLIIDQNKNNEIFSKLFGDLAQGDFQIKKNTANSLTKTFNVVAADPTQNQAVILSEGGENYIIQGPPGTGKSQTIANLIANFIANGKKILFVCEKRAALDVVYHRLKNEGLDELCCLIHDSQADKKEFILNLKNTYSLFSKSKLNFERVNSDRLKLVEIIESEILTLQDYHIFMNSKITDTEETIRDILEVLILNDSSIKQDILNSLDYNVTYSAWSLFSETIKKLYRINLETNQSEYLFNHPFRFLKIYSDLEAHSVLNSLEAIKDDIENLIEHLDVENFPVNANSSIESLNSFFSSVIQIIPFFENNTSFFLYNKKDTLDRLDEEIRELKDKQNKNLKNTEVYPYWSNKLSNIDALNALSILEKHESSFFNFFSGDFRNVKKELFSSYNLKMHKIKPRLSDIVKNLLSQYEQQDELNLQIEKIEQKYKLGSIDQIRSSFEKVFLFANEKLLSFLSSKNQKQLDTLKILEDHLLLLNNRTLKILNYPLSNSLLDLEKIASQILLKKQYFQLYVNQFKELRNLNSSVYEVLLSTPISLVELQKALAEKTIQNYYASNFEHKNFNMDALHNIIQKIKLSYKKLFELNGIYIKEKQISDFKELMKKSEMSVAGMSEKFKEEKKNIVEGRKILENEFSKTIRYKSIRDLSSLESGEIIRELKPVWLMSPLSVSDTLPLDENYFDVVIFDEASQITLEEGLPPIYRAKQAIIVGDEMQMPPSNFFGSSSSNTDDLWFEEENDTEFLSLDADSFLNQGVRKFPSIMLGWHYRSKHESLIGFSNASFYQNKLLTVPDVKDHQNVSDEIVVEDIIDASNNVSYIKDRPISYHFIRNGVYESRTNNLEAKYIAQLILQLLNENSELSIGVVAFSMEQQNEIESEIQNICITNKVFEAKIEEEYKRIEDNQFVGLFIKNLENIQGDERDIIIMSTCFGYDSKGKMIMNFGPINKRGGEKRLNVLFSRAKKRMVVVSSIKYYDIKNEYNDGANYFRKYLQYSELISNGNVNMANSLLNSLSNVEYCHDKTSVVHDIKKKLEKMGYFVNSFIGQSRFKCSLGIKHSEIDKVYSLGIIVDDKEFYRNEDVVEQHLLKSQLLNAEPIIARVPNKIVTGKAIVKTVDIVSFSNFTDFILFLSKGMFTSSFFTFLTP